MTSQLYKRGHRRMPAASPESTVQNIRTGRLDTEESAATAEPEETLVADPRGGLRPAQLVERKLLALMQAGNPGLFMQAAGRPQDIRRRG
jgi:hypothetical protein